MRPRTSKSARKHTGWREACDYDKPHCLPRSSPRLWERMGRNAKETRRSQAYSSKVGGVEGNGGSKWRRRGAGCSSLRSSAETTCVSTEHWSIPSAHSAYFGWSPCSLSLCVLCVCMYMYTRVYIRIYAYIYVYIHVYTHTQIYIAASVFCYKQNKVKNMWWVLLITHFSDSNNDGNGCVSHFWVNFPFNIWRISFLLNC